jgi:hypothetical protein
MLAPTFISYAVTVPNITVKHTAIGIKISSSYCVYGNIPYFYISINIDIETKNSVPARYFKRNPKILPIFCYGEIFIPHSIGIISYNTQGNGSCTPNFNTKVMLTLVPVERITKVK